MYTREGERERKTNFSPSCTRRRREMDHVGIST